MSKFNKTVQSVVTKTTNFAGGTGYREKPELALVSLLLTSFAQDQFYRTAAQTFDELKRLLNEVDPLFAAKALIYARTTFGMRSITHVGASELSRALSGTTYGAQFYNKIVHRPDDITEIMAYHKAQGYKLTNAMRKGFAERLNGFDKYQLAKYKAEKKALPLKYALNRVHPKPLTHEQSVNYLELIHGTLKNTETWEAKLSKAGENEAAKLAAWAELIGFKKIGYLALLRNLRNILKDAPEIVPMACTLLVNEKQIAKSLILPFQYNAAYEEVAKLPTSKEVRMVLAALSKAFDLSMANVPRFPTEDSTLVVLDVSSSMTHDGAKPAKIGAQFATVLAKTNNADLVTFDTSARYVQYSPTSSANDITRTLVFNGGGTRFCSFIELISNRHYDRIIVLSDMQGWDNKIMYGSDAGEKFRQAFNAYRQKHSKPVKLYSFDLAGYGSLQVPQANTYVLAGFSDKIFDVMKALEEDPNALVNTVKAVTL